MCLRVLCVLRLSGKYCQVIVTVAQMQMLKMKLGNCQERGQKKRSEEANFFSAIFIYQKQKFDRNHDIGRLHARDLTSSKCAFEKSG